MNLENLLMNLEIYDTRMYPKLYDTRKCDTRIHLMKLEMNDTRKFPDDTRNI